ncbi:MAG: flagellar protein FlgN [Nitrospinota bacterium]
MKLTSQLIKILEQNADLYDQLAEKSDREKDVIQSRSLEALNEIIKAKETIVLKLKMLEEARRSLIEKIGAKLNMPSSEITLSYLAQLDPNSANGEKLLAVGERLADAAKLNQNHNDFNGRLINRAMGSTLGSLQFINKFIGPGETYSSGKVINSVLPSGRLVAKSY